MSGPVLEGDFDCELIETMSDPTGTLSVHAYAAPIGADGAILRQLDNLVVIASNRSIYVFDTARGFCTTPTQYLLPADVAALGKAQRMITHEDRFIIAYELGVASIPRDLSRAEVVLRFGDHFEEPLINTKTLLVLDRTLLIGGWQDVDAFDNRDLEAFINLLYYARP